MVGATIFHFLLAAVMLVAFGAGLRLCVAGVRGRRIGDHPYCPACGYDLYRRAHSQQCPECGEPHGLDDIDRGEWRTRRPTLLAGIALILASTTPITLGGCFDHSVPAPPRPAVPPAHVSHPSAAPHPGDTPRHPS